MYAESKVLVVQRDVFPTVYMSCSIAQNAGESQCSYVLGDEHMEVRCGLVDPARSDLSKTAISVESSSSSVDSSSSEESSSSEGSGSSDDESSESSSSNSGEDTKQGAGTSARNGRGITVAEKRSAPDRKNIGSIPLRAVVGPQGEASIIPKGVAARNTAIPVGIPARGPAVLYRCKVLHGLGSTFLVLSCPNVAYVAAVRDHSIVTGARGKER